ncbi:Glyoxalase/bleomycin resistance protein/dioxygenase [Zostera marina]|uniref:Glyoxalase/bleomycin resistance protein/dioxygenase n=1 Tax=Zostera marina TaxID=29655 RepID=A0A0K9PCP0_ZOSMR|nr:Glyoxalase/bleomycin resistance protein/dioxygenase [Zostera marina]
MSAEGAVEETVNGASAIVIASFMPQIMVPANKTEEAVTFYKTAFGAEEVKRVNHPKRKAEQDAPLLLCAELKIGGSSFLICDLTDEFTTAEPKIESKPASGVLFRLEADDVAVAVASAVSAGGVADGEVTEEEGPCGGPGSLVGKVKDPFGHLWAISLSGKCCPLPTTSPAT